MESQEVMAEPVAPLLSDPAQILLMRMFVRQAVQGERQIQQVAARREGQAARYRPLSA